MEDPIRKRRAWGRAIITFFIPGIGHAAAGYSLRAAAAFLLVVGVSLMTLQILPFVTSMTTVITLLLLARLVCAWDALHLPLRELPNADRGLRAATVLAGYVAAFMITNAAMTHNLTVGRTFYIPSESMMPTLKINDYIAVDCYQREPHRGDVMVFNRTRDGIALVKRVVALAGDQVEVRKGKLYVNGAAQNEPYISEPAIDPFPVHRVSPHSFFAMGDNRNNSEDSRYIGDIPDDQIIGRATWIFFSDDDRRVGLKL